MAIKKDPRWAFYAVITSDSSKDYFTVVEYENVVEFEYVENTTTGPYSCRSHNFAYESLSYKNHWSSYLETDHFLSMVDKHFDDFVLMKNEIKKMNIGVGEDGRINQDPGPKLNEIISLFELG